MKRKKQNLELLLILLLGLVLTLAVFFRTTHLTFTDAGFPKPRDHHKYIEMALNGAFNFHIAPFCRRVLVPAMAGLLPFSVDINFMIMTCAGLWGAGVVVYFLSKKVFSSSVYGGSGLFLFFSLGWAVKFVSFDFWLPDGFAFFWIALAFLAIYIKNDLLFILSLVFGVLTKELVIFVIPLYYTLQTDKWIDLNLAKRTVLLALPVILTFVALRLFIPAWNDDQTYLNTLPDTLRLVSGGQSSYSYLDSFRTVVSQRYQNLSAGFFFRITMGTFGAVITLLSLAGLRKNLLMFVRFLPFFILIYTQLLFAVDTQRLLAAAFPAVIILTLAGMKEITVRLRIAPIWLFPLTVFFFILNLTTLDIFPVLEIQLVIFALYLAILWNVKPLKA